MKSLKEFINESVDKRIAEIEEILRNNNKDKIHFNVGNNYITFIGDTNEKPVPFGNRVFDLLDKSKIKLSKYNFNYFQKVNDDKCPIFIIADKDYLESIKKNLEK